MSQQKPATTPAGPVPRRYRDPRLAGLRRLVRKTVLAGAVKVAVDVELHGHENVEGLDGPFVVVANHSSHLDTALIYAALPDHLTTNLAAGAAADHFFLHWYTALAPVLLFNAYPIDRPGRPHKGNHKGLSTALLQDGTPLLIFPEGTRSRTGAMATFTPGVGRLCSSAKVPCVPVALVGCADAWPAQARFPRWPRRTVHVVVGRPLEPRPNEGIGAFTRRVEREVVDMHDATAERYGMRSLALLAARRVRRR
ncbi:MULTISPECIES: lysophospholipid acyltransferase family protein [unclassified Luteococcus]|uniref:lysophospholipid acyltransferase family protein n=1 Tax=unclassified Luteococcus TaxID=2639923 RepID=UPI00313CF40B